MAVRSEASRKAVLQATMELLDDKQPGSVTLQKLSIEGIARRAGVSKMTIYRWWPEKTSLVIDSFLESHVARTPVRTDGAAIDALREHLTSLAAVYASPEGRLVAQLIAECQYEPDTLAAFKTRFWEGRHEAVDALIKRAIDEGDLRSDLDPFLIAELLYGPVYFRLLLQTGPLDADYAHALIDMALRGLAPA